VAKTDVVHVKAEHSSGKAVRSSHDRLVAGQDISESAVSAIIKRSESGRQVRRKLPSGGYLHLDRQLPFLLLYRRPARGDDSITEQLLRGEASYLIVDGRKHFSAGLSTLVSAIAESLAESFGAFLLIEIWAGKESEFDVYGPNFAPAFNILTAQADLASGTTRILERALRLIKVQRNAAQVSIQASRRPWAPRMPRLLSEALGKQRGYHHLGIAIRPVYRDSDSGEAFPLILRRVHRGFGRAIRRAVFAFTREQTSHRLPHFHALGPRSLVKLVWKVDRELAEIANAFDFLLSVTPINSERAWAEFKRARFSVNPHFIYRPLPVDPAQLKRRLYRIPIENIEDPALEALFRAQRMELDRHLTMLSDRDTRRFLYGSLQLYGAVEEELFQTAGALLEHRSKRNPLDRENINATVFAELALQEIDYYREQAPDITSRVELRDDVVSLLVSQGNLLINRHMKIPKYRVEALLAHEIGTHVLTYFNGQSQPFQQLYCGLPDYEALQEGIAVLSEYLTGGLTQGRLRILAARVMAAHMMIEGCDFITVFRSLNGEYGFSQRIAYNITLRIFRGGGYLKDMVYLRGLKQLLDYLGQGGEFDVLLLGKFGSDHLGIIRELQWRKVLNEPRLKPRYLEKPEAQQRLAQIQQGLTLQDLAKRI